MPCCRLETPASAATQAFRAAYARITSEGLLPGGANCYGIIACCPGSEAPAAWTTPDAPTASVGAPISPAAYKNADDRLLRAEDLCTTLKSLSAGTSAPDQAMCYTTNDVCCRSKNASTCVVQAAKDAAYTLNETSARNICWQPEVTASPALPNVI